MCLCWCVCVDRCACVGVLVLLGVLVLVGVFVLRDADRCVCMVTDADPHRDVLGVHEGMAVCLPEIQLLHPADRGLPRQHDLPSEQHLHIPGSR